MMTEGEKRWIRKHTEKSLKELSCTSEVVCHISNLFVPVASKPENKTSFVN